MAKEEKERSILSAFTPPLFYVTDMKSLIRTSLGLMIVWLSACGSSSSFDDNVFYVPEEEEAEVENGTAATGKVVIGYLPLNDWQYETLSSTVEWEYLTHVNVCFLRAKSDGTLNTAELEERLAAVRSIARQNGVKILVSVAKNSSGEFATAINNAAARQKLIDGIVAFTKNNNLDGFDIDYEDYSNWDANFPSLVAFSKGLYEAKEKNMLMTCAVNPRWLTYSKEWGGYFDYINIMSYDHGATSSDTPVQHASYEDFVKDLEYWNTKYGIEKGKLVGGLPFYGFSWDEELDGVDSAGGIRYSNVLKNLGREYSEVDQAKGKTYYNGRPTIAKKCQFVLENDYAGVMIWQLLQDAYGDNADLKLLRVIGKSGLLK